LCFLDTRILEKDDEGKRKHVNNAQHVAREVTGIFAPDYFLVNARGLSSKINLLREYAASVGLDMIGIAETFLDHDVNEAELSIYEYNCYRKDRDKVKGGRGGGVTLYVKYDIVSYEYEQVKEVEAETVWCKSKRLLIVKQ
jgi:hypothetical protein